MCILTFCYVMLMPSRTCYPDVMCIVIGNSFFYVPRFSVVKGHRCVLPLFIESWSLSIVDVFGLRSLPVTVIVVYILSADALHNNSYDNSVSYND